MLSHWLIVLPRNQRADYEVPRRLRAAIAQHLYYKPEQAHLHRHDLAAWTLSLSANTKAWSMDTPFAMDNDAFAVVSGVPTLEALPGSEGVVPERMASCAREHGAQYVFANVGGTFSLGMLNPQGASAFADFSGYSSCFYLDTADYFAVGNLPGLVGGLRPGFPDRHDVDISTLCWVAATTMVMGDRTPLAGVRRLRTGQRIEVAFGRRRWAVGHPKVTLLSPTHFDRLATVDSCESIDYRMHIEAMRRRLAWCGARGIRFRSHLTGGRDTRTIAAILSKSDALQSVMEFRTNGSEANGDVLIARQLARVLGIEDRHTVRQASKQARLNASHLVDTLARSAFVFGGQLTPFDGRAAPSVVGGNVVTLMGGGGEIYRQEWGPADVLEGEGAGTKALNLFARYDRLDIVGDACREYHETVVAQELAYLNDRNVANLTCAFYLEARLANWGCAHFSNSTSAQFPLLLDLALARSVFGLRSVAEHVHFELLRHCDESLLRVPFLNNRWSSETEERAKLLGFPVDPMIVEVERNFPWQFDAYRRYRNGLVGFCIENGDALGSAVSMDKLSALRKKPVEPFSSAHVKMLFGLVAAIFLAERGYVRTRDLDGATETRFFGNATGRKFRKTCEDGNWHASDSLLRADLLRRIVKSESAH